MTYHRGFLLLDAGQCSRLPEGDPAELARVAERARAAEEQGLVHLVQRRHGATDYAYLIVAKPRPPDLSSSAALPISKVGGAQ